MRGVSLTIETIIIIILAISVLSVMLLFFRQTLGDASPYVKAINDRTKFCGNYHTQSNFCQDHDKVKNDILKGIQQACVDINIKECTGSREGTPASEECVKSCCGQIGICGS